MPIGTPTVVTNSEIADATDNPATYDSGATWQASANTLYLAVLGWSYSSGGGAAPSSVTGGGLTFTLHKKQIYPVTTSNRVIALYYAASASPGAAADTIITPGATDMTGCAAYVLEVTGTKVSGVNGVDGIVQAVGTAENSVTTLASPPTLSAFADATNNMGLDVLGAQSTSATFTAGTGFTLVGSQAVATTPAFRVRAQYKTGEDTAPNFSVSSSTNLAMLAAELAIATAGGAGPTPSDLTEGLLLRSRAR